MSLWFLISLIFSMSVIQDLTFTSNHWCLLHFFIVPWSLGASDLWFCFNPPGHPITWSFLCSSMALFANSQQPTAFSSPCRLAPDHRNIIPVFSLIDPHCSSLNFFARNNSKSSIIWTLPVDYIVKGSIWNWQDTEPVTEALDKPPTSGAWNVAHGPLFP